MITTNTHRLRRALALTVALGAANERLAALMESSV